MEQEYPTAYVCWNPKTATKVLAIEALEGNESQFLATHVPIRDFEIRGSNALELSQATEEELYQVLSEPVRTHAFCLVQGEAGAGKSHLIRWLDIRWDKPTDLVVLIQRADGSLEGTLENIRRAIPERFRDAMGNIGHRHEASLSGKKAMFQTSLAATLRADYYSEPMLHDKWCAEWPVSELLLDPFVLDNWSAPKRILEVLSGKSGERDSVVARFTLYDIAELAAMRPALRDPSSRMVLFVRRLEREAREVIPYRDQGADADESWQQVSTRTTESARFVEALNARLNSAIQNVLGISSSALKDLFLDIRRKLRTEGKRLVLLLEDITNFQGIDNQLVDVLVTQSSTRAQDDLCPIISVVGVTPFYYKQYLPANYVARITHEIILGMEQRQHQDVAFLRTPSAQAAFSSRYLNAARLSMEELNACSPKDCRVPNRCESCPVKLGCHAAFGHVDGVGLYPFTRDAIHNLFESLTDVTGKNTYQTPRGMLKGVLAPTLGADHDVAQHLYPGAHLLNAWIPEDSAPLSAQLERLIDAREDHPGQGDRLRVLLGYWGDRSDKTSADGDSFSGIHRGVFESFGLPWLGDHQPHKPVLPITGTQTEEHPADTGAKPVTGDKRPRSGPPVPKRTATPTLDITELRAWKPGQTDLPNASKWNKLLYDFVRELPWTRMEISVWIAQKLFTEGTVQIEGTRKSTERHFVVPAMDWLKEGLDALLQLPEIPKIDDPDDYEWICNCVARMQNRLMMLAATHVSARLGEIAQSDSTIPGVAAAVLCAREWLAGTMSSVTPLYQQWQTVLRDIPSSPPDTSGHVERWGEMLKLTEASSVNIRMMLREWVRLPRGETGVNFVGAADAYYALCNLSTALTFGTLLNKLEISQATELFKLAEYQDILSQRFERLAQDDFAHLRTCAGDIRRSLRGNSIRQFVSEVDEIAESLNKQLSNICHSQISSWKQIKQIVSNTFVNDGARALVLETFVDAAQFQAETFPFANDAAALAWCISAPSGDVSQLAAICANVETVLSELCKSVSSFVELHGDNKSPTSSSMAIVQNAGAKLSNFARAARKSL